MGQEPEDERLVGVFRDEHAADEAAEAARAAGAKEVSVGASEDEVAALRGEMREEAAEARPGFYTPEMLRSVPRWTAIATLVGVVVALPLGFIGAGDLPLVTRLLVVAFAGAVTGLTIGFIFGSIVSGGFFGPRRRPKSELAAERGVVVGANESTGQVTPTLSARDSIRVDKVAPSGQPEDTVTTEGE
jgi:hypothetical protein